MGYAAVFLSRSVRRVVLVQSLLSLLVAVASSLVLGWIGAISACYGGAISIVCALLLGWRVRRAGDLAWHGSNLGVLSLCTGMVERFGIALAGFAFGIGVLQLPALPQLTAFAIGQFAYLAAARDGVAMTTRDSGASL
ncbi:MAG: ATP synthase subunit I [Acidiferrobacterales bacterium]